MRFSKGETVLISEDGDFSKGKVGRVVVYSGYPYISVFIDNRYHALYTEDQLMSADPLKIIKERNGDKKES